MMRGRIIETACFISLAAVSLAAEQANAPVWRPRAQEVTQYLQNTFWDPKTSLYRRSVTDGNPDFMWPNGVAFSALVAAARHQPQEYGPVLERFFKAMDRYWDTKVKIPGYEPAPTPGGGNDKYYDDNAWMVLTFLEAHEVTRDPKYLARAAETLKFVLSGWDNELGGGIWWHERHKDGTKNTCINAPAAVACLRMARFQQAEQNTAWATKLVAWTREHLQDRDGLFDDRQVVATGEVKRGKLTYNTALMIRALLGLHARTGKAEYLDEAKRIGRASDRFMGEQAYRDDVKWSHLMVEADLELYRVTQEPYLMERARKNGEHYDAVFRKTPPKEMMQAASIARLLWLLADTETPAGQTFWKRADQTRP
jgi:hypothetical protein